MPQHLFHRNRLRNRLINKPSDSGAKRLLCSGPRACVLLTLFLIYNHRFGLLSTSAQACNLAAALKASYHHRTIDAVCRREGGGELHVLNVKASLVSVTFRRRRRQRGWKAGRKRRRDACDLPHAVNVPVGCLSAAVYTENEVVAKHLWHARPTIAAQLRASRFTHESANHTAADANGEGWRKTSQRRADGPGQEAERPPGLLPLPSKVILSSLGQTAVTW